MGHQPGTVHSFNPRAWIRPRVSKGSPASTALAYSSAAGHHPGPPGTVYGFNPGTSPFHHCVMTLMATVLYRILSVCLQHLHQPTQNIIASH
ncbi:hypothetical protein DPX16_1278 [Anabarilius grahami]|uniref:Uncharacterized protein n=1 Tax=Anabarilius grahami TaxID=495550 RepID=A0A3N0Z572_ANAGA|nr:hypothetical protein DPX16_1278 [Anabarilius grahami]